MVVALAALGAGFSAAPASAALFSAYNPAVHDRFTTGTTPNPTFLLSGYDLSGIAYDPTAGGGDPRGSALISPLHVLTAWHHRPTTVTFLSTDGIVRTYAVAEWIQLTNGANGNDVAIGRLGAEVSDADNVNPLAIAVGPDDAFIGYDVYAFDQNNRAGRNIIDGIGVVNTTATNHTVSIGYDFDTATNGGTGGVGPDEIGLVGGDSGYSAVVAVDGQLALVGAHFAVSETPSMDVNYWSFSTLARDYLDQINTIVTEDGYTLSTIVVPEPSSLFLLGATSALLMLRRRPH
jgi:hypothetical protein